MNENINLSKILKNCPKGTKLYSTVFGEVEFDHIYNDSSTIGYKTSTGRYFDVTYKGKFLETYDGECTLFPSKDQRDWSKFTAPWYKKNKFDPNTLKPFDKILVRISNLWRVNLFSNKEDNAYRCIDYSFKYCIPYNDETKYLVGTTEEAPEFYRYWED